MKLELHINGMRSLNERTNEIVDVPDVDITLEHSLWTISKWEAKYHKSFLDSKDKTNAEMKDYISMMIVTPNVPKYIVNFLTSKDLDRINDYIKDPMTATTFREDPNQSSYHSERVTSELIYYWMIASNIPASFEHWHISRLLTLIRVCSVKNSPPKKRSARDIMASNAALNAQRRKALNSRG